MQIESLESNLTEVVVVNYDGDYDEDTGEFTGQATAKLDNETQYEGVYQKGLFHGKGKFTWPDGVVYEGDFQFNTLQGKGTYTYADGSVYVGDIVNGKRHGQGKLTTSAGQVYEGEWTSGMRHGKGKMSYSSEKTITYTGEWVENNREGYGVMIYPTGNVYEGEWKKDKKAGYGTMVWKEADEVYTGQWLNDSPHGFGEHIWGESTVKTIKRQACNMYRGEFYKGQRQGKGTFFYANGSQYTGFWESNAKHGIGAFIHVDNRITVGHYVENKLVSGEDTQNMIEARDTGDITPQFYLNVLDILTSYPHTPWQSSSSSLTEDILIQQRKQYVRELERLILKYNAYMKNIYKKYVELAIRDRQREVLVLPEKTLYSNENKYNISMAAIKARSIQKRFHCMSIETMIRFLRDVGLIDAYFTVEDFYLIFKKMRKNRNSVILQLYRTFITKTLTKEAEANGLTDFVLDLATLQEYTQAASLSVGDLLDAYLNPRGHDADFMFQSHVPILEHEFVELFVRVVHEAYVRRGFISVDLYQILSKILHQKILPLLSEGDAIVSDVTRSLYIPGVQDLLKNRQLLSSLASANNNGSSPSKPPINPTRSQSMASVGSTNNMNVNSSVLAHANAPVLAQLAENVKKNKFEELWISLKDTENREGEKRASKLLHGGAISGEGLLNYFLDQKGQLVSAEVTAEQLTALVFSPPSSNSLNQTTSPTRASAETMDYADPSLWSRLLSYEDFIEIFCKVLASDFWILGLAPPSAEQEGEGQEVTEEEKKMMVVSKSQSLDLSSSQAISSLQVKLLQFLGK